MASKKASFILGDKGARTSCKDCNLLLYFLNIVVTRLKVDLAKSSIRIRSAKWGIWIDHIHVWWRQFLLFPCRLLCTPCQNSHLVVCQKLAFAVEKLFGWYCDHLLPSSSSTWYLLAMVLSSAILAGSPLCASRTPQYSPGTWTSFPGT